MALGLNAHAPQQTVETAPGRRHPALQRSRRSVWDLAELRWAAVSTALFAAGGAAQLAGAPPSLWWGLYLACYVAGGWEPGLAGLRALSARRLDVDLLMVAAAVGAAAIGQVTDGALLVVIFASSGGLEAFATRRTADSVAALLDLAPDQATRLDASGDEQVVDTALLRVGDVILVRPGERIGGDGQVLAGASEVDQATVTGEPLAVPKQPGDEVFAGTLNGTGALTVRVERDAAESVIARIVALVADASATKAPTQLFIEKVEQRYSVAMVAATLALFAIPIAAGQDLSSALLRAMTFMIVASPCAVVLATMPPLLSAIANAGRHGVLVKSAVVMERLGATTIVALDKTGTLTDGTPHVTDVRVLPDCRLDEAGLLRLAAVAEHPSEHPLARAIVDAATHRGVGPLPPVTSFTSTPGRGVDATIGEHTLSVGSPTRLLDTTTTHAATAVADLESAGRTAVVVLLDGTPAGVIGITDRLRPDAATTITRLTAITGTPPLLLTGDNPGAATPLAHQAGITDIHASLLPADKAAIIRHLEAAGHTTLLVGDGVNDAPALATAHTGIAMGRAGSDLALETADAVIIHDELATLPTVIALSQRARRLVTANLTIAATTIAVLVTWDLTGHLPLPLGVAGHEGSTIIVALNGLRLLRTTAWHRAARHTTNNRGQVILCDSCGRADLSDVAGRSVCRRCVAPSSA